MAIDFNVASKIDNDDDDELKILSELIIDQDLNPWSEFRASIAIVSQSKGGGDDSLQSLFTRLSTISAKLSNAPTACVVLGDEKQLSEISIADEQVVVSNNDIQGNDTVSEVKCALTPMEQRDMQSWNDRLSREKVFSRYYNPERWELSELETIQKLLGVENTETPRFFVSYTFYSNECHDYFYPLQPLLFCNILRMSQAKKKQIRPSSTFSFQGMTTRNRYC